MLKLEQKAMQTWLMKWRQASPWEGFMTLDMHSWGNCRLSQSWYSGGFYCYKNYRYHNLEGSHNLTFSLTREETEAQRWERDCLIGSEFMLKKQAFPSAGQCFPLSTSIPIFANLWAMTRLVNLRVIAMRSRIYIPIKHWYSFHKQ